ncbi:hypothetical protein ACFPL7_02150 [Dongia soli]|uniref:Cystathionine beta-lyase/cystathionine gamma-synthase n=1 Tax=Dongia soli TaxID=600628 RepID=A0ABU5EFY4_9PROT|nr:hypothetical protein [Dongia soli]MDY0885271.1 hypothetical protein [Dongia soli]
MTASSILQAIREECEDLSILGRWFAEAVPSSFAIRQWNEKIEIAKKTTEKLILSNPVAAERKLDALTNELRLICLRSAHRIADPSYRSPPKSESIRSTSGRRMSFGYERELDPQELEERCKHYHSCPEGWTARHILFSSGQTALTSLLMGILSSQEFPGGRPITLTHTGGYFETTGLLSLLQAIRPLHIRSNKEVKYLDAAGDIDLIEPVFYDGISEIRSVGQPFLPARHAAQKTAFAPYLIFDTTLAGPLFAPADLLASLSNTGTKLVACVNSGLKLDQAGLELSNVGIVSLFSSERRLAEELGANLHRIRSLTGGGLSLDSMQALEVPWFLDKAYQQSYAGRIFANNAALARAFADTSGIFAPLSHPALMERAAHPWAVSPFCIFQLKAPSRANYHTLARWIETETEKRRLAFDCGGSFGFRGHRYEVILPEDEGTPPFLRVAMGARAGWSRDGIIALLKDLAERDLLRN